MSFIGEIKCRLVEYSAKRMKGEKLLNFVCDLFAEICKEWPDQFSYTSERSRAILYSRSAKVPKWLGSRTEFITVTIVLSELDCVRVDSLSRKVLTTSSFSSLRSTISNIVAEKLNSNEILHR